MEASQPMSNGTTLKPARFLIPIGSLLIDRIIYETIEQTNRKNLDDNNNNNNVSEKEASDWKRVNTTLSFFSSAFSFSANIKR